GVNLARLEGAHLGGRIGAVVDELDTVEIGFTAPPLAVLATLVDNAAANFIGDEIEGASTDRAFHKVCASLIECRMHDERRIVGKTRNDRHVGSAQLELYRVVVNPLDRAVAELLGVGVDQGTKTGGHRIA